MRIAVVGAGGQLGAALVHECAGHETTAFGRAELDISDAAAVAAAMARVGPDVILNAAAFTNVDAAEDQPIDALNSNAFGVRALARAARVHGAALVHYSTDFVFDGRATTPYLETAPPSPQSVYGASKLLGEWFAEDAPRAYVLRVEGIFGQTPGGGPAKGSAAGILKALTTGAEAKVFEDRVITPSHVSDVARATPTIDRDAGAHRPVSLREFGIDHLVRVRGGDGAHPRRRAASDAGPNGRHAPARDAAVVLRAVEREAAIDRHRDAVVAGRAGTKPPRAARSRLTPSAAPTSRMNSARCPCRSSPLNCRARASTCLCDAEPLNSLFLNSIPNSATAAAKPISADAVAPLPTATVISALVSASGCL